MCDLPGAGAGASPWGRRRRRLHSAPSHSHRKALYFPPSHGGQAGRAERAERAGQRGLRTSLDSHCRPLSPVLRGWGRLLAPESWFLTAAEDRSGCPQRTAGLRGWGAPARAAGPRQGRSPAPPRSAWRPCGSRGGGRGRGSAGSLGAGGWAWREGSVTGRSSLRCFPSPPPTCTQTLTHWSMRTLPRGRPGPGDLWERSRPSRKALRRK